MGHMTNILFIVETKDFALEMDKQEIEYMVNSIGIQYYLNAECNVLKISEVYGSSHNEEIILLEMCVSPLLFSKILSWI